MNFRLTALLAAAAALLGLLLLLWDGDEDGTRERLEQVRRAFRFDPARVDRLVIESEDQVIECRLEGRQWRLTRPIAARADPVAIARLLGALQELRRGDIILPAARADDAYAPYGLDRPRATIAIVEGAVTNRILIGRRTPLGDGVYVRQSDHAGLARLDPALLDLLPARADALRDRALLAGAPAAIERLDIRGPAGYIQLARNGRGAWRLYQPFAARADSAAVAALIRTLLACSAAQFVQDDARDLAPYGLDSQSAVTAVLNTDAGDGSQMLSLGDPLPGDPALVYARLQGETGICAVPLEVRQALLVQPDDLRDRRVPGVEPDGIRSVRVEAGESVLEFARGANDLWQIAAPFRAPADDAAVRRLLATWTDVRFVPGGAPRSQDDDFQAVRTIRITLRDPRAPGVVLRLAPDPDGTNTVRIAVEGESAPAAAAPATLLEFPLDPMLYRSREILSIPADDIADIRIATAGGTFRFGHDPATGQWSPAPPWLAGLLAALAPLRAETLRAPAGADAAGSDPAPPFLTLHIDRRGQGGLATTLVVGPEESPGGPRTAHVRGRDLLFTLAPETVAALLPPAPETPE